MLKRNATTKLGNKSKRKYRRRLLKAESLEKRMVLTTYFVDADFVNSQNDGTEENPFASINRAVVAARRNAGDDEIVVAPRADGLRYDSQISFANIGNDDGAILIRGATGEATDVVLTSGNGNSFLINAPLDITIRDLTIEDTYLAAVRVTSPANVLLENIRVDGPQDRSGVVHQSGNMVIRDSLFENLYHGIFSAELRESGNSSPIIGYPGSLTVEDVTTTNNAIFGILTRNALGDVNLDNVTATGNGFSGIRVFQQESITISNAVLTSNADHGLSMQDTANALVAGGTFSDNGMSGLSASTSPKLVIAGGLFDNNGEHGIRIENADGLTIDRIFATNNGDVNGQSSVGGGGISVLPSTSDAISISNSYISNNESRGNGGGIQIWSSTTVDLPIFADVTVADTTITGNVIATETMGQGGGVAFFGYGDFRLERVTVSENSARGTAGVHAYSSGPDDQGSSSSLSISESTIANNMVVLDGPGNGAASAGLFQRGGYLDIVGSTISGNVGGNAGGLFVVPYGGSITNSTITDNRGVIAGGLNSRGTQTDFKLTNVTISDNVGGVVGGLRSASAATSIGNTVIARNQQGSLHDAPGSLPESDIDGTATTLGGNFFGEGDNIALVGNGSGPDTDFKGTVENPLDPMLGELQDNGGATLTRAPLAGSPLLEAGNSEITGLPALDQRGVDRILGRGIDIGSVETPALDFRGETESGRINLNSADKGGKTMSIVLYSTATSDVSQIQVDSIAWAGASVHRSKLVDVDGDGRLDLVLKFRLKETDLLARYTTALQADQDNSVQQLEIELTGNTLSGNSFTSLISVEAETTGKKLRNLLRSFSN
ncbi:right-handed parallel beta-helix repeat-containing protein [Novipirellula sp. SH528]|uniref:right-handed parallel beta-helix repeat-containing protein n=1 Tax=Novipirellula sp. SH528 TaxID=3454466 RepID=UPI003FA15C53